MIGPANLAEGILDINGKPVAGLEDDSTGADQSFSAVRGFTRFNTLRIIVTVKSNLTKINTQSVQIQIFSCNRSKFCQTRYRLLSKLPRENVRDRIQLNGEVLHALFCVPCTMDDATFWNYIKCIERQGMERREENRTSSRSRALKIPPLAPFSVVCLRSIR